jgi:tRNA/rRNA methyltransferase
LPAALSPLHQIAFVLFKPKSPGNVGAAARALKNMGFADLRLVAPQRLDVRHAAAMAVHGGDVLAAATTHPTKPLREAAQSIAAESGANRIAIVFGPEDFGLTNAELKLCQRLLTIPTASEYPSLNLAQAVMVVAYEIMLAAGASRELAKIEEFAPVPAVDAMLERMAQALIAIGFLPEDNPDHIMFALRALFGRSGLKPRELDILNGIANQVRWFAEDGRETLALKRRAGKKLR